ncbi:tetratricopeptide repeat protein [Sphingobium sp. H39-3-25]|uniref:tetratricopeptide repeat protein n=1 Tax=Sphingobium arseniciresistens TaxID=3030834 RepID=UPI0023B98A8B|nr:tetratricopeptide repeat protein [Sphingobium arseniciresistens]
MKNKIMMLVAGTALALSSGAAIAGQPKEVGYKTGSLGVSAIVAGDYATAAQQLTAEDGARATDPARLINLGNAYAGMGRYGDAHAAYAAAYQAPAIDMMLADGSVKSSRMIAQEGMRRLRSNYAAR